jgi:hypothetical protein
LQEFNTNLSTLLPFSRINEFVEKVKGERPERAPIIIPYKNPFEIEPLHKRPASKAPVEPSVKVRNEPAAKEKPASENVVKEKSEEASIIPGVTGAEIKSGYHIIGGCFRSKANAANFADNLKSKNIEASVIGKNRGGYYMVSIFSASDLNTVNEKLSEMKSTVSESVWIHKQ